MTQYKKRLRKFAFIIFSVWILLTAGFFIQSRWLYWFPKMKMDTTIPVVNRNIGLTLTSFSFDFNASILYPVLLCILLFYRMSKISTLNLTRTSKKQLLHQNAKVLWSTVLQFTLFTFISMIIVTLILFPQAFIYFGRAMTQIVGFTLGHFLFYAVMAEIYQVFVYLTLSGGQAIFATLALNLLWLLPSDFLHQNYWLPTDTMDKVYMSFYSGKSAFYYHLQLAPHFFQIFLKSASKAVIFILIAEVIKHLILLKRDFIIKDKKHD